MRRVILALVSTVAALVMLLSFKTHSTSALTTPPAAVATTGTSSPSRSSTTAGIFTGSAADTRYGPVQVRITVKSGTVTSVEAINYPNNDPRDAQINAYAIPVLNSEATSAGNANINMVSGATYTSYGYIRSLQSALNRAGL